MHKENVGKTKYPERFRENVVRRILSGESAAAIFAELRIKPSTGYAWKKAHLAREKRKTAMLDLMQNAATNSERMTTERHEEARKSLIFAATEVALSYPRTAFFGSSEVGSERQRSVDAFLHGEPTTRVLRMIHGWVEFVLPNLLRAADHDRWKSCPDFINLLRLMLNDLERTLPLSDSGVHEGSGGR